MAFTKIASDGIDDNAITTSKIADLSTIDTTNLEVTNIKAKDGTTAMTIADSSGNVGIGVSGTSGYKVAVGGSGLKTQFITTDATNAYLYTDGNSYVGTISSTAVVFVTNNAERMRINSSGNVGIGSSSISSPNRLDVVAAGSDGRIACRTQSTSGNSTVEAQVNNYWTGPTYTGTAIQQYDSAATGTNCGLSNANLGVLRFQNASAGLVYTNGGVPIVFGTSNTERMRIDSSGNLLVNTTVTASGSKRATKTTSGQLFDVFLNGSGSTIGYIGNTSDTGTVYSTASDYRLKENIQPMQGALAKIAQLNPVTYTWKADGSAGQGFIAHELQAVVPDCVTGEKDAVDAEGRPQYQGVDTSFLVATLTAAIQELKAEFDAYKTTHP